MGKLSNLQDLYLRDNQLIGEIPPELCNLSNLETLSIAGNAVYAGAGC